MSEKDKLLEELSSKSGKEKSELETLVEEKTSELSGLVSEEGAIYIIANDLGVKLGGGSSGGSSDKPKKESNLVKVEDINEARKPVSFNCKVAKKYDLVTFNSDSGEGKVQSLLVGDETGIIRVVFWNENVESLEDISEGDILNISNAFSRENTNNNRIEVHFSQYSEFEKNPEGVEITLPQYRAENIDFTQKNISDLEENDRNVKIRGIIADFDIPRYYLGCPHTYKKVFQDEGKYFSPSHGEVEPIKVPIVNLIVDDSSGTISTVAFRDRAESLLNLSSENIISLSEDIDDYKEHSNKVIGKTVELGGNVNINNMTGDLQFLVNAILESNIEDSKDQEESSKEEKEEEKEEVKEEREETSQESEESEETVKEDSSSEEVSEEEPTQEESQESEEKEEKKEEEDKKSSKSKGSDDDDIDIEEIDIDDDLL